MNNRRTPETGLCYLLDLDGELFPLGNGYWAKIEVALAPKTSQRPHGIKYSLTLHNRANERLLGYDNAHAFRPTWRISIMKPLKVGIMSFPDYQKRTIAIASGKYRRPKDDPKVWFESIKSMAQVLSSENQALLKLILDNNPRSLTELQRLSNRNKANLSRTLKKLEQCGVVELTKEKGRLVPTVKATDFRVEFGLNYSCPSLPN